MPSQTISERLDHGGACYGSGRRFDKPRAPAPIAAPFTAGNVDGPPGNPARPAPAMQPIAWPTGATTPEAKGNAQP